MSRTSRFAGAVRRVRWLLWGSLLCTLVATAHAEYTLAVATGMHFLVAGAVPGALDLYVVASLRQAREVLPAVLLSVAANVVSHLVAAQVLPMHWGIISAVGAVAPVLLWRVHALWKSAPAPLPDGSTDESTAPEGAPAPLLVGVDRERLQGLDQYAAPEECTPHPSERWGREHPEEHTLTTWPFTEEHPFSQPLPEMPLYVPEPWFEEGPGAVSAPAPEGAPAPLLDSMDVHPEVLLAGDADHIGSLVAYLADCTEDNRMPSARGCKEWCSVGWPRAKRLMAYVGLPSKEEEQ